MKDKGKKSAKEINIEDVGKVEIDKLKRSSKFTQPVVMQSFLDDFHAGQKMQVTPTEPNTEPGEIFDKNYQSKFQ